MGPINWTLGTLVICLVCKLWEVLKPWDLSKICNWIDQEVKKCKNGQILGKWTEKKDIKSFFIGKLKLEFSVKIRKKVKVTTPQWLVLQYKRGHPEPPWFDLKPNFMQFWCFSTGAKPKNHRVFLLRQHWDWSHKKEGLFWWNCWKLGIDTQALSRMDNANLLQSGWKRSYLEGFMWFGLPW